MGISYQQIGQNEVERIALDCLIDAYDSLTGEQLTELASSESADFICACATAQEIGAQLTEVRRGLSVALHNWR